MRKVIHYKADSYLPLTETWIYEQIKNLKRYKPIVYTLKTENSDIYPTKDIRSLQLSKIFKSFSTFFNEGWNILFNFYPGFLFSLLKDKPVLIHAHFGPSGYNFLFYKRLLRLPMITAFYGYDMSKLLNQNNKWKKRYLKLFKQSNFFLVEGHNMKKNLIRLGCSEAKIIIQPIGIDLKKIKFIPRKTKKNKLIRLLIASSFREKKGIPYAIEAFKNVKESHPELSLELTIIGDSDGENEGEKEKKRIFNLIYRYNLKDCVKLLGFIAHSKLLKEAKNYHIFISPSITASDGDNEGGVPVAIIEMSASGMPIISTKHCDIPEVVINGKSGLLANEKDVDDLTKKLEFLILNPEKWKAIGEYGRRHIEKKYNLEKTVDRLEKIYDMLLSG